MYREQKVNTFTWIDLEAPTKDEITHAMKNGHVPLALAEELFTPESKAHTDVHTDYIYLALTFPAVHRIRESTEHHVDILVSPHTLITARHEPIDTFTQFNKTFEVTEVTHPDESLSSTDLGIQILRRLYRSTENELEDITGMLRDIEKDIFRGQERNMLTMLARVGRTILDMQHILEPHQDVLHRFFIHIEQSAADTNPSPALHIERQYAHLMKQLNRIVRLHAELRATNDSLLSNRQNEIMQTLTIMAFVTFPLSLIAGIFGMNTTYIPLVGYAHDFWVIVGFMFVTTLAMFMYFKRKKWL